MEVYHHQHERNMCSIIYENYNGQNGYFPLTNDVSQRIIRGGERIQTSRMGETAQTNVEREIGYIENAIILAIQAALRQL
jgi:hypothetical protein